MTSLFGDNTVVGPGENHVTFNHNGNIPDRSLGKGKGKDMLVESDGKIDDFITVDYTFEERPFFVPIGKDGILGALQKLDTQLRNVRLSSHYL